LTVELLLGEGELLGVVPDFYLAAFTNGDGVVVGWRGDEVHDGAFRKFVDFAELRGLLVEDVDFTFTILDIPFISSWYHINNMCCILPLLILGNKNLLNRYNLYINALICLR